MPPAITKEEKIRLEKMKYYEKQACREGYQLIAGIDEVGRGPIAGPVVAAAVILPSDFLLSGVNDSKVLSEKKRLHMAAEIKRESVAWSVAIISPRLIDDINILQATKQAMHMAVRELKPVPDFLLIDALTISDLPIKQYPIIKGDALSMSIACASIIAKVERDWIMQAYDDLYPGYGFAGHKGYGTREHITALKKMGPTPIHRQTFEPLKSILGDRENEQICLFD